MMDDRHGLGARLLRAGAEERPASKVVERTVLALGAGTATLGAASLVGAATSAPSAALGAGAVLKLLGIGAAFGVAASGATWGVTTAFERESAPARPHPRATATVKALVAPPVLPSAVPPPPAPPASVPQVTQVADAPAPRSSAAFDVKDEGAPLAREVGMVDRAHAALKRGDARAVLAELAPYEQTFETPRLLPEVFALRMEASQESGDDAAARLWAERLLSRFPKSAHAVRAKAILER
jgi:hypothetical protein